MNRKTRELTICRNHGEDVPRILLAGQWLKQWGYAPGDRVMLSQLETGTLALTIRMPAAQWLVSNENHAKKHRWQQMDMPNFDAANFGRLKALATKATDQYLEELANRSQCHHGLYTPAHIQECLREEDPSQNYLT